MAMTSREPTSHLGTSYGCFCGLAGEDGNMRGIAFAYDPSGYWVELVDRMLGLPISPTTSGR